MSYTKKHGGIRTWASHVSYAAVGTTSFEASETLKENYTVTARKDISESEKIVLPPFGI